MGNISSFKRYVITGALSLGVIGAAAFPAFAETNVDEVADDSSKTTIMETNIDRDPLKAPLVLRFNLGQNVDETKMEEIQAILKETKAKLEELGVKIPAKFVIGNPFKNLDEDTKEKVQGIMEKVKSGELSCREAHEQLEELGVQLPMQGRFIKNGLHHTFGSELKENSGNKSSHAILRKVGLGIEFKNLDEDTKEEVFKIMDKGKSGEITPTEAQQQLKELGINLHMDFQEKLDDTTKEKVQQILKDAQTKIKAIIE